MKHVLVHAVASATWLGILLDVLFSHADQLLIGKEPPRPCSELIDHQAQEGTEAPGAFLRKLWKETGFEAQK